MLQYVAGCCNVREICSQCVCVSSDNLSGSRSIYHPNNYSRTHPGLHILYKQTTHTLQDTATVYCKVLPPTLCNTLQHTATLWEHTTHTQSVLFVGLYVYVCSCLYDRYKLINQDNHYLTQGGEAKNGSCCCMSQTHTWTFSTTFGTIT